MATISRLKGLLLWLFYTPKKSAILSLQKKSPTIFVFFCLFSPGWNPVWLASRFALCRPLFSPMLFDCCVWWPNLMWASRSRRFGLAEKTVTTWSSQIIFHRAAAEVSWRHVSTSDRSTMPSVFWFLTRPNIPAGRTWLSTVAIQRVVAGGIEEKPNHFLEPLVIALRISRA